MIDRSVFARLGRRVVTATVGGSFRSLQSRLLAVKRARIMLPVAFSHTMVKELPQSPYEAAIVHLNSLQSNAVTLQKSREKRGLLQEMNVPDTILKLSKCGIEVRCRVAGCCR